MDRNLNSWPFCLCRRGLCIDIYHYPGIGTIFDQFKSSLNSIKLIEFNRGVLLTDMRHVQTKFAEDPIQNLKVCYWSFH